MTTLNLDYVVATASGLTTATTTYAANDVLGAIMSWNISNAKGLLTDVAFIDQSDVLGACELYLFDRSISPGADNAAFAPSDADALFYIGKVSLPAPDDVGGCRIGSLDSLGKVLRANATTIFGVLVTLTANAVFAGGATSVQVNLGFSKDQ